MTPDQHARIKSIFLEACAQPTEHRAAFVSRACDGDELLLRDVERLLAHHLATPPSVRESPAVNRSDLRNREADISALPTYETGDLVADRYRIVSLLGEGAMGKVYRAEDDRLHQTVALKFLPRLHVLAPVWRHRVESEVKLSREVGHSNICRVYDLGEVDGAPFISMEYVDGEDLASLLRRVGRLAGTRAIEIARQLCAGLAAAHIHGVLHRDLKPANVMIDQSGRVRITDFGLAELSGHVALAEIRAGTPRYMAPEQLAGVAVTEKSDIYALGLVMYEMFTGQPAFDADNVRDYLRIHQTVEPKPPSAIVPEIDPKVEAVILACLRKDPAERPDSALNVAAALPGGDLLTAALDAGEIPTREMLATVAAQGHINRRAMYQIATVALVLLFLAILIGNNTHPIAKRGGVQPPEVLLEKAREISRFAGYAPSVSRSDGRFFPSTDVRYLGQFGRLAGGELPLAITSEEELLYYYRERPAGPRHSNNDILSFVMPGSDPFDLGSGSDPVTTIIVDGRGRLLLFESPPNQHRDIQVEATAPDWKSMIRAAGCDPEDLIPTPSRLLPGVESPGHLAYLVNSSETVDRNIQIEISMRDHHVQFFAALSPTIVPTTGSAVASADRWAVNQTLRNLVLLILLAAAIPAAWTNWRNRGDLTGAVRLGGFVFALRLLGHLISMRSAGSLSMAIDDLAMDAVVALCEGMIVALFYLAVESQVRRHWPRTFGSWSRILAGRIRDPIVGRDMLVGCTTGAFWAILTLLDRRLPAGMGWESHTSLRLYQGLDELRSARFAIAGMFNTLQTGIYQGLVMLFILVIVTWLAKPCRWLALLITWLIGASMFAPIASHPVTAWTLFALGIVAVGLYLLTRWGLVSLLSALFVAGLLNGFPITTEFSTWYAGYGVLAIATTIGLGFWSLYEATRLPVLDLRPSTAR